MSKRENFEEAAASVMMRRIAICAIFTILLLGGAEKLFATSINASLTADNTFFYYLNTVDTAAGTQTGTGTDWEQTYVFNDIALAPGVTNYLHIKAENGSGDAGFLGSFILTDADFSFENNTQALLTNASSDWGVNGTGFNAAYVDPTSYGTNGGANVWTTVHGGQIADISTTAEWIWTSTVAHASTTYFSTAITYNIPIPEPATIALLGIGLAGGALRRRLKKAE